MIIHNSEENRNYIQKLNIEYIRYLKLEESILKQKSQLHWFKEGDANTKYFHALLTRSRMRKGNRYKEMMLLLRLLANIYKISLLGRKK